MSPDDRPREPFDPYTPAEMAGRVEAGGVAKAMLDAPRTLALAVLAGAFIGLGGMAATIAGTDTGLGHGPTRLLMGIAFSLGNLAGGSFMVGLVYWFIYLRKR